jgi:hypothetical protein
VRRAVWRQLWHGKAMPLLLRVRGALRRVRA